MKYRVILFAVCLSTVLHAQKFDYVWVMGRENQTFDTTHGGSLLDFNFRPPKASYHYREHNMFTTNSSICDSAGNLLFYTNGCVIVGADDEVLENGDNINPGSSHTLWCNTYEDGYSGGIQSSIILPVPESSNIFYLFHKRTVIFSNPLTVISDNLYYSRVDMNENGGEGSVTEKNIVVMSDTLSLGEMVATKHANGKDWWLVTTRKNSNTFYIFKFNHNGVVDTLQQTIGILPDTQSEGLGQMVFSPDGSKLYRTCRYKPAMVYSFDREAGVFTQFDTIHFEYGNQLVGEIGCAVSPNNQYLYLSCRKSLYQLDVFASDISSTQTKVAEWDGYSNPFPTMFWQCQMGPDCKVYVRAGGDTRYYHVIHNPDEPGLSCNVEQRGVKFQTPTGASMPSFPNYRLGPLDNPGVPCTATVSVSPQVFTPEMGRVQVWPNPADEILNIEYRSIGNTDVQFLIFNSQGQIVQQVSLQAGSESVQLSLKNIPAGVYWYVAPGVDVGKFLIQR